MCDLRGSGHVRVSDQFSHIRCSGRGFTPKRPGRCARSGTGSPISDSTAAGSRNRSSRNTCTVPGGAVSSHSFSNRSMLFACAWNSWAVTVMGANVRWLYSSGSPVCWATTLLIACLCRSRARMTTTRHGCEGLGHSRLWQCQACGTASRNGASRSRSPRWTSVQCSRWPVRSSSDISWCDAVRPAVLISHRVCFMRLFNPRLQW